MSGRPGAAYVDLPSNILMGQVPADASSALQHVSTSTPLPTQPVSSRPKADSHTIQQAAQLLQQASRYTVCLALTVDLRACGKELRMQLTGTRTADTTTRCQ